MTIIAPIAHASRGRLKKPSPRSRRDTIATLTPQVEIVQLFPPSVSRVMGRAAQQAYTRPIIDSGHAGAGDRETDRAPACPNGEPAMPSLFFTCPKTRQQADTGIMTDVESLRDTWSMTLNVNCPHCGEMQTVSVRETYIDDAIRNVSEIAQGV
jgi:hypothetical protein